MSIRIWFLCSHAVAALAGAVAVLVVEPFAGPIVQIAVAAVVTALIAAAGWHQGQRMGRAVASIEDLIASSGSGVPATGMLEIDEVHQRLLDLVRRLSDATATGQEQIRELTALAKQMDRRGVETNRRRRISAHDLRQMLAGITKSVDTELVQFRDHLVEIDDCTQQIAKGAEQQNDAVNRTTSYVEQISTGIDALVENTRLGAQEAAAAHSATQNLLTALDQLCTGVERMRAEAKGSSNKLRALSDRSRDIGSLVQTIGEISSRTDLLALNASIESVRAGEHGRGFAMVAEEVRKLAEQTAQAIREVSAIVSTTDSEVGELILLLDSQHQKTDQQFHQIQELRNALDQIRSLSETALNRGGKLDTAMQGQLELAKEVVLTMERIAEYAKHSRNRSEKANWTVRTLSRTAKQFDIELAPLRGGASGECSEVLSEDLGAPELRGESVPEREPAAAPLNLAPQAGAPLQTPAEL